MNEPDMDEMAVRMVALSAEMYAQLRAGGATPAMAERLAMRVVIKEVLDHREKLRVPKL